MSEQYLYVDNTCRYMCTHVCVLGDGRQSNKTLQLEKVASQKKTQNVV